MIDKIISFSINNKFIIGLFVLTLIGAGLHSMLTVNLGSVPDITNNQVQVITVSENLATEDIEQFVTYPVELGMGNLPGVNEIRSVSRFGLSVVTIVFEDDMGTYLPRQLVQEKLNKVKEDIPEKFGSPSMGPITTGLGEIYQYTIEPKDGFENSYTPTELRTIQDWIVKRQMTLVDGVVEVNSFGGSIKQYEVAINPEKLNAMDVSISEVYNALARNNDNTGGAYIEKNRMANFIRGEGLIRSLDDIRNVVVKTENGIPILIDDVAENVQFGTQTRYGAFTKDGHEAVGGMILMLKGANPNDVIQNVKQRMKSVESSLPEGLEIKSFLDRSDLISRTTSTVTKNLIEGALIVVFVLVFLLGSLRGGLITASLIPLSLLFAFILMKATGVWANLMSLGAIDFGIIVDGAVIIVEGTVHEIEKKLKSDNQSFSKKQMNKIAYKASSTMMNSAFFGQLIILIVFAPILFLEGIEGKMFKPMAFTFGYAVLGAIILCLTYVPMMSSIFMRPTQDKNSLLARIEHWLENISDKLIARLQSIYTPLIRSSLRRKNIVLGIAIVLFLASTFTFTRMGGEFIPQLDEGDIAMQALIRSGSGLSESISVSEKAQNILLEEFPEIKTVVSRIGVADIPTDPMPMDIADMAIVLEKDKAKWTTASSKEELIEQIKQTLNRQMTGVNLVFSQPVELRFNELLTGVREDVAIKLYGEDLSILGEKAREIAEIVETVEGVGDVSPERISGLPQMTVQYDRKKIAQYGLDIQKLNEYVSSAFAGGVAGIVFEGEKRFDLVVRFDEEHRQSIENLRSLYIDLPSGSQVPIKEVATIDYQPGPMQISRDNTFRRTYVGLNTRGRDVESVVTDIQEKLDAELELPAGYYITYGGEFENLQRAKSRLGVVVPIALFLIFILLYFALNSVSQAVMIYLAIPLASIGGVFLLALRDMSFSISAGVGFIVLFGVAVLNGLVLISRFNSLKEEEEVMDLKERIMVGTKERLRPILLTATAAILGFTPMAFSTSAGAEVQRPLATVVIGGLISATLLTLVVLPVLYSMIEERKKKKESIKALSVNSFIPLGLIIGLMALSSPTYAQPETNAYQAITLEQAVERAFSDYPAIKAGLLEIESQRSLKKTAWELGDTELFTGEEEVGNGSSGVKTQIGIRQELDIFSVAPRLNLQSQKEVLAERKLDLSEAEIELAVRKDWVQVYTAYKIFKVLEQLDTQFKDITKAANLRLETEASSKLEYLATLNQANRIRNRKEQAYRDYLSAIETFNKWFNSEKKLTAIMNLPEDVNQPLIYSDLLLSDHPVIDLYQQRLSVAEAETKEKRSQYLPKFNAEYGRQEVAGQSGFYKYQIGIKIPLTFWSEVGQTQSAKINQDIAEQNLYEAERKLNADFRSAQEQYQKWLSSWEYYKNEALPLAKEQRKGALTAYKEGAIDYVKFLQNMRDAIAIEVESWNAFGNYLNHRFQLEFYVQNSN